METFLIYIGKTTLAASAFYLLFFALFQNREQFVFNRIYLPVSLAISFIIPLLKFTSVQYVAPSIPVPTGNTFIRGTGQLAEISQPAIAIEWYHILFGIYILGVAIFLFNLLLGHYKALCIIKKSRIQELFNTLVNITIKDVHPFSFFSKIVLSEKTLSHPNLDIIVSHERIHVKEKHTLDIFITEILFLLQWFNPFAWLIKDTVKNNLEYKTDAQIAMTTDVQTYQLAMVTLADKNGVAPFLTALNGSQLKNRIIMMKRKNKNKYAGLKQLIVLPLLAVLVMGLAKREIVTEIIPQDTTVQVQDTLQETNDYDISKLLIIIDGEVFPSNSPELKHINLTEENRHNSKYIIEIIEALNISMDDITGSKSSMNPGNPYLYIRTKNYIPGTNKAFEENFEKPTFIKEKIIESRDSNKSEATNETEEPVDNSKPVTIRGKVTNEKGNPIEGASVVVSGRPFGVITDSKGNYKIEVEPTDKVLIFGYLYHDKKKVTINGKDKIDVVIPTNLEPAVSGTPLTSSFRMRNSRGELVKPIYFINENEVNIDDVDRHFIKTFSMLPDSTATRLYGEKGKNGIVVVTMKNPEEMQTISGRVTNEKGESIIGASITEYDELGRAVHGTLSDRTGHYVYVIKQENSSIRVRHFDYQTKELEIEGKEIIDVQLERNQFHLSEMKIVIDGNIIPSNTPELKSLRLTEESRNNGKYVTEILEALDINIDDVVFSKGSATSNNPELYIRTKNYKPGTNPEFEKMTEMPVARIEAKVKNEEGEPAGKLRYTIAGIEVSGIRYLDKTILVQLSGLQVGQNIEVPGETITNATKKLWQQGLFSDVKITAPKIADNKIWLDIFLQEKNHPQNSNQNDSIIIRGLRSLSNGGSARNAPVHPESNSLEPVYSEVEEMPEFPRGELALRKFIANSLRYPVKAQEAGIQGKVYVSFIVDKEGNVTDARIEKGANELLDEEALRVVNSLPRWKPGTHEGKKVNVSFTVPIHFGLQDKKSTKLTAP